MCAEVLVQIRISAVVYSSVQQLWRKWMSWCFYFHFFKIQIYNLIFYQNISNNIFLEIHSLKTMLKHNQLQPWVQIVCTCSYFITLYQVCLFVWWGNVFFWSSVFLQHINYLHVAPHRQQQQVDFVGGGGVEQFRDISEGGRQQPTLSETIGIC